VSLAKAFLVSVPGKTADTLMAVFRDWIEPVCTVVSDCWSPYWDIETHGFTHKTLIHTIDFVSVRTGAHTNAIEST